MKLSSHGMLVSLLQPDLPVGVQVEWAIFLAAAGNLDLLVLQRVESDEDRVEDVSFDQPDGSEVPAGLRELLRVIDGSPLARAGARQEGDAETPADDGSRVVHLQLERLHYSSHLSLRRQVHLEARDPLPVQIEDERDSENGP